MHTMQSVQTHGLVLLRDLFSLCLSPCAKCRLLKLGFPEPIAGVIFILSDFGLKGLARVLSRTEWTHTGFQAHLLQTLFVETSLLFC